MKFYPNYKIDGEEKTEKKGLRSKRIAKQHFMTGFKVNRDGSKLVGKYGDRRRYYAPNNKINREQFIKKMESQVSLEIVSELRSWFHCSIAATLCFLAFTACMFNLQKIDPVFTYFLYGGDLLSFVSLIATMNYGSKYHDAKKSELFIENKEEINEALKDALDKDKKYQKSCNESQKRKSSEEDLDKSKLIALNNLLSGLSPFTKRKFLDSILNGEDITINDLKGFSCTLREIKRILDNIEVCSSNELSYDCELPVQGKGK